jgi:hypothetical protein
LADAVRRDLLDTVNLVLSVPVIVAIVELGKKFGLTGRWAMLAAVVAGIGLSVASFYLGASGGYQAALQGGLLGLAAAGLYDTAKVAGVQISAKPAATATKTAKSAG